MDNKSILNKVIKQGAFGGTFFKNIYSSVNDKWYKNSWKEFDELKGLVKSIIVHFTMSQVLINMVLSVEHH